MDSILFRRLYDINDRISVVIPTVRDVLANEDAYYELVTMFTAMPFDLMVMLDDAGIDFTQINEYELFLILFKEIRQRDLSMIFADLDLSKCDMAMKPDTKEVVIADKQTGDVIIDRLIHAQIANAIRKINSLEKNLRRPANEEARKYELEKARKKLKRRMRSKPESQLEPLIISMVNTEQFKYDFDTVQNLTIYQFNESVKQVVRKVNYDNRMYGVYSGTINAKELSQDDLNWLTHSN